MEFEFDKFIKDIDKRNSIENKRREVLCNIQEMDRLRRLRAERYHERWQNQIEWRR